MAPAPELKLSFWRTPRPCREHDSLPCPVRHPPARTAFLRNTYQLHSWNKWGWGKLIYFFILLCMKRSWHQMPDQLSVVKPEAFLGPSRLQRLKISERREEAQLWSRPSRPCVLSRQMTALTHPLMPFRRHTTEFLQQAKFLVQVQPSSPSLCFLHISLTFPPPAPKPPSNPHHGHPQSHCCSVLCGYLSCAVPTSLTGFRSPNFLTAESQVPVTKQLLAAGCSNQCNCKLGANPIKKQRCNISIFTQLSPRNPELSVTAFIFTLAAAKSRFKFSFPIPVLVWFV